MLNQQDRDAIDGLFDRIDTVAERSGPRDPDAEVLIQQRLRQSPEAPYYMAQTILVQEQALQGADRRIAELEAALSRRPAGGGFLGGLFGDREPVSNRQPVRRAARGPWDAGDSYDRGRGGGGFLAGAAQTALGVTSGVLLGSAIAGMFSGEANAAEYDAGQSGDDAAGSDGGGSDGGDFGDFDVGGDF